MTEPSSTPDRDPLVSLLMDSFKRRDDSPLPAFGTAEHSALMIGTPIEEVADRLRKLYLQKASKAIQDLRATSGSTWDPASWVVVSGPAIFHGWTEIDGVRVWPTSPLPWGVYLVHSPEWFENSYDFSDARIKFGPDLPPPVPLPYVRVTDLT